MANIRHVVVIRKDLNLSTGLIAAQVAHISDAWMRNLIINGYKVSNNELEWCQDPYLSVLAVDNPEELNIICTQAKSAELKVHEWRDLIPSVNLKQPLQNVLIGISIGPADFDAIKAITGNLPLA